MFRPHQPQPMSTVRYLRLLPAPRSGVAENARLAATELLMRSRRCMAALSLQTAAHHGPRLGQPRARDGHSVLLPVLAIEQLQRQRAAEADARQVAEERGQRR